MNLPEFLFHRFRTIGRLGRLLIATCVAAVFNIVEFIVRESRAFDAAETNSADGYALISCRMGPPAGLRPRFFITCFLLVATVAVFRRSFPRSRIAVVGLLGALTVYGGWWVDSYRFFGDVGVPFINHPGIRQTAYLYAGNWLDAVIAASVAICLVLFLDRLLNPLLSGEKE